MAKKTNYHHGDLKNALLDAALALLEETGPDSLSLRAVANRVGVSHAAPEHHFPTRKHLLTALATVGFIRFEAAMRKGRQKSLTDDADQMRGAMHGYLEYAAANPGLFRLMFTNSMLNWDNEDLKTAASASYQQLAEISAPAAAQMGLSSPEDIRKIEMLVWSYAHGYAHLFIDHKIPGEPASCDLAMPQIFDLTKIIFR